MYWARCGVINKPDPSTTDQCGKHWLCAWSSYENFLQLTVLHETMSGFQFMLLPWIPPNWVETVSLLDQNTSITKLFKVVNPILALFINSPCPLYCTSCTLKKSKLALRNHYTFSLSFIYLPVSVAAITKKSKLTLQRYIDRQLSVDLKGKSDVIKNATADLVQPIKALITMHKRDKTYFCVVCCTGHFCLASNLWLIGLFWPRWSRLWKQCKIEKWKQLQATDSGGCVSCALERMLRRIKREQRSVDIHVQCQAIKAISVWPVLRLLRHHRCLIYWCSSVSLVCVR